MSDFEFWLFMNLEQVFEGLTWLIISVGFIVGCRSFLLTKRWGYALLALYFLLPVLGLIVQKMASLVHDETGAYVENYEDELQEPGEIMVFKRNLNFPLGPALLVTGFLLIAPIKEQKTQQ